MIFAYMTVALESHWHALFRIAPPAGIEPVETAAAIAGELPLSPGASMGWTNPRRARPIVPMRTASMGY